MESEEFENYRKAGEIATKVRKNARESIKKGQKLLEIAERIEKEIESTGGKPAFPVNLSRNEIAAHYTPKVNDESVLREEVLKVDIGVQVEGFIADSAFTLDFTGKFEKMVEASEKALQEALETIQVGVELKEIGRKIQETIKSFGFQPIQNLSGHGLAQFLTHSSPTIPNFDNNDWRELEDGMVFAIEPFATNGKGFVKESSVTEIYALSKPKPVRNASARQMLEFIAENYNTLPFAERWIQKELEMDEFQRKIGLRELLQKECISAYPLLKEENNGIVTQAETSVVLKDEEVVILVK